jgi:hypothetical protein
VLGEKPAVGFTVYSDLADTQKTEVMAWIESERIKALTTSDKAKEKTAALEGLMAQSVAMRSRLEIKGTKSTDALTQATAWYNAEVVKVEAKYA